LAKIKLVSFGFKYGVPRSNYYFDVGFIKNPARENSWDFFCDTSPEMCQFVLEQEQAKEFIDKVVPLIEFLSTIDQNQIFAFGCSAGRHRSTVIVDSIASLLKRKGINVDVEHRDME
jgi:UPF0042 nucleotide-binding protein